MIEIECEYRSPDGICYIEEDAPYDRGEFEDE